MVIKLASHLVSLVAGPVVHSLASLGQGQSGGLQVLRGLPHPSPSFFRLRVGAGTGGGREEGTVEVRGGPRTASCATVTPSAGLCIRPTPGENVVKEAVEAASAIAPSAGRQTVNVIFIVRRQLLVVL